MLDWPTIITFFPNPASTDRTSLSSSALSLTDFPPFASYCEWHIIRAATTGYRRKKKNNKKKTTTTFKPTPCRRARREALSTNPAEPIPNYKPQS